MDACERCHGTGVLYRQDSGNHGLTLPCPDCLIDEHDYDDYGDCFKCGGEGFVYGCAWDWQCDTYDEGEGTCLCARRCDICNPPKLTPEQQQEHEALRALMKSPSRKDIGHERPVHLRCVWLRFVRGAGHSGADCSEDCAMTAEYFTCASCTMYADCQASFGAPGDVGIGCADWTPSARITSDKDRENPVEGAPPYGDGLIGRITALEAQLTTAREIIAQIEPDFRYPPSPDSIERRIERAREWLADYTKGME